MTRRIALIGERSYRSRQSLVQMARMSLIGCDLWQKRVPVSSGRQISDHLGVWARSD
jgi:hypothetical protein